MHANRTFASIPAGGVLGLRWDASIDQVRKAFPDDRRSGSESTKLSHLGTVELGSPRLPKGVPAPTGDLGHSALFNLGTGMEWRARLDSNQ